MGFCALGRVAGTVRFFFCACTRGWRSSGWTSSDTGGGQPWHCWACVKRVATKRRLFGLLLPAAWSACCLPAHALRAALVCTLCCVVLFLLPDGGLCSRAPLAARQSFGHDKRGGWAATWARRHRPAPHPCSLTSFHRIGYRSSIAPHAQALALTTPALVYVCIMLALLFFVIAPLRSLLIMCEVLHDMTVDGERGSAVDITCRLLTCRRSCLSVICVTQLAPFPTTAH